MKFEQIRRAQRGRAKAAYEPSPAPRDLTNRELGELVVQTIERIDEVLDEQ